MQAGKSLTIGQVARAFGFTLRALRFYEEKGLISPRRAGTHRLYSPADRERIGLIARCRATGMSLEDISLILAAPEGECAAVALCLVEMRQAELIAERADIERRLDAARSFADELDLQVDAARPAAPEAA